VASPSSSPPSVAAPSPSTTSVSSPAQQPAARDGQSISFNFNHQPPTRASLSPRIPYSILKQSPHSGVAPPGSGTVFHSTPAVVFARPEPDSTLQSGQQALGRPSRLRRPPANLDLYDLSSAVLRSGGSPVEEPETGIHRHPTTARVDGNILDDSVSSHVTAAQPCNWPVGCWGCSTNLLH